MRHTLTVVALAAALAAGGCGGGDDDAPEAASTPTPTATPADPEATATPSATAEGAPAEAVAEQTGLKARGWRDATIDIRVLGLEVHGKLATLTLEYTAHNPSASPDETRTLYEFNGSNPLYVTLLDGVNLRRYNVVEDTAGQILESRDSRTQLPLDTPTTAQYTFAAPPPDVTEIDVAVGDWPPFRDVPLQR